MPIFSYFPDLTNVRRTSLREQYYFDCDCKKCLDDDSIDKFAIKCSQCQSCVPVSSMTCLQCGVKEVSSRRDKYLIIGTEYEELMIENKGGHPEPEEQVCETKI